MFFDICKILEETEFSETLIIFSEFLFPNAIGLKTSQSLSFLEFFKSFCELLLKAQNL